MFYQFESIQTYTCPSLSSFVLSTKMFKLYNFSISSTFLRGFTSPPPSYLWKGVYMYLERLHGICGAITLFSAASSQWAPSSKVSILEYLRFEISAGVPFTNSQISPLWKGLYVYLERSHGACGMCTLIQCHIHTESTLQEGLRYRHYQLTFQRKLKSKKKTTNTVLIEEQPSLSFNVFGTRRSCLLRASRTKVHDYTNNASPLQC